MRTTTPRPLFALLAALASGALAAGCASSRTSTPRSRVASDLGCTTEATVVQKIEDVPGQRSARWQVTGCGRSAVYLCTTPVRDCWREGEVRTASTGGE